MTIQLYQPTEYSPLSIFGEGAGVRQETWFPNFTAALNAVDDHLATRLSTIETKEQHTRNNYRGILRQFFIWLLDVKEDKSLTLEDYAALLDTSPQIDNLPTHDTLQQYVAYLATDRKLSSVSIGKYLAAIKHLCRALGRQYVDPRGGEQIRFLLSEARNGVVTAVDVTPPPQRKKSKEARRRQFNWYSADQLLQILHSIPSDLEGLRDRAILTVALNSALRVSELSHLTLSNFEIITDRTVLIVNLRGKGSNWEPIPIDKSVYDAVIRYYNTYNNHALPIRRLDEHTSLWMPLTNQTRQPFEFPVKPLGRKGIARIIKNRSTAAGYPMNAHDTRRNATAHLEAQGFSDEEISQVTRHQSLEMVRLYKGSSTDWDRFNPAARGGISLI